MRHGGSATSVRKGRPPRLVQPPAGQPGQVPPQYPRQTMPHSRPGRHPTRWSRCCRGEAPGPAAGCAAGYARLAGSVRLRRRAGFPVDPSRSARRSRCRPGCLPRSRRRRSGRRFPSRPHPTLRRAGGRPPPPGSRVARKPRLTFFRVRPCRQAELADDELMRAVISADGGIISVLAPASRITALAASGVIATVDPSMATTPNSAASRRNGPGRVPKVSAVHVRHFARPAERA